MPRTGIGPTTDFLQEVIKKARSKKDPKDFKKNIAPNLAELVPLPDDITDLMDTIKVLSTSPEARKMVAQEVKRGLKEVAKDPIGKAKQAAIENPVDLAAMAATGGIAGLRRASYALPLHVRSYLRSMAHIPTKTTKLPKKLEPALEADINRNLDILLRDVVSPENTPKIKRAKDIASQKEYAEGKYKLGIDTTPEETVSPAVSRLIEKKIFNPEEEILPIPHTWYTPKGFEKITPELENTLGKYFLSVDPKQKDIIVKDLHKFYDIFGRSTPPAEAVGKIVKDRTKLALQSLPRRIRNSPRVKDKLKSLSKTTEDIFTPDVLERFGVIYGGEFPIEYRLPINNPQRAEIQRKLNQLRIRQLDPDYIPPRVRSLSRVQQIRDEVMSAFKK